MGKENTPTGFSDERLKIIADAWADSRPGFRMAEAFACAAASIAEACQHMDRFLSIAEQFKDGAFEDASVIPEVDPDEPVGIASQLRQATGDPDLQIDYTDQSHPVITTKCNAEKVEALAHELGPVVWGTVTVQAPDDPGVAGLRRPLLG